MLTGTAQLLAESHLSKLSHSALKSTFISKVACGERHVLFLTSSGFVYSMGSNELGQLGNPCEEVEQDDDSFTTLKSSSIVTRHFNAEQTPGCNQGNSKTTITYQSEPAIIFGLLNQRVVEIVCGANHNAVRSQTRSGST